MFLLAPSHASAGADGRLRATTWAAVSGWLVAHRAELLVDHIRKGYKTIVVVADKRPWVGILGPAVWLFRTRVLAVNAAGLPSGWRP